MDYRKLGDIIRILVDGDGCPVIDIIEKTAKKYELQLIIFTNYAHQLETGYGRIKKYDIEAQEVDMAIANNCQVNDIIITQDYGLAALVLGKGAYVINNNGYRFTEKNIDELLMRRHHHAKMRRAGKKHTTQSKREANDNQKFKRELIKLIEKIKEI
ncbi:MAG: YaiI/YqxD family protein [Halanaerobiales bacterium]